MRMDMRQDYAVLPTIDDPGLQFLYDYWREKRAGKLMPARGDLDPTDIPAKLWSALMLLDVVGSGAEVRFRFRLVGTSLAYAFGRDPTGAFIDDVLPSR